MKKEEKKLFAEVNQSCFITVTELAEHKISIYVTEKAIMIRDNKVLENSMLIPLDEYKARREELLNNEENDAAASQTDNTASPAVD